MSKYKVLLPTNGHEVGSEVELSEEEANNYNAGEPTPRVEIMESTALPTPPADEGTPTPPSGEEPVPPTNPDIPTPPASDEGAGEGAGSDAGTGEGEGGENAGDQNA